MGRRSVSAKAGAPASKEQPRQRHDGGAQPPPVHDAIRDSLRSSTPAASPTLSKRALRGVGADAVPGSAARRGRGPGRKKKERGTVVTEEEVKDAGLGPAADVQERGDARLEKEEESKAGVETCEPDGNGEAGVEICEPDGNGEADVEICEPDGNGEADVEICEPGGERAADVEICEPGGERAADVEICEPDGKGEADVEICEPGGKGEANDGKGEVDDGKGEGDGVTEGEENGSDDEEEEEGSDEDGGSLEVLGEGFYEVEAVRKKRVRKGTAQYYIKWRGWPESANTWEPFENVKDCADIIEEFEKSHISRPGRKGKGKRRFGTYLLPPKKKQRTSPSSAEEGPGGVDLGKDTDGTSNNVKVPTEQNGEKLFDPIVIDDIPPIHFSELEVPFGGVKELETKPDTAISTPPLSTDVASIGERDDAEFNVNVGKLQDGIDIEQSQDKLMILTGETLLKDVMIDASGSGYELVNSPNTVSTKVPLDETRLLSNSTSVEIVADSRTANGHCEVKEEPLAMDAGQLEHAPTTTEIVSETPIPIKESARKRVTSEEPGKLAGNDKCTGAKKRKQGFVRRVRQGLESQERDGHHTNDEEKAKDIEHIFEESKFVNGGDSGIEDGKVVLKTTEHQYCPPQVHEPKASAIIEITKAVTFSSSTANGKQDVSVLFKALRSDGLEVMVDNTFLRANYPLLLIDFYEQHLRYSTA